MELTDLIANLGFPIAVCTYLLIRLEAKMEALTASIRSLTDAIQKGSAIT